MQVTETSVSGLKRELQVIVPRGDIDARYQSRVNNVKDNAQLKGFRKGKVPATHIKKLYGRSLMIEVLEETLNETSRKAIEDRKERPASQPKIEMTQDKDEVEKIVLGEGDLTYKMAFEVLPAITLTDFSALKLERDVAVVTDEEIDKAIEEIAKGSTTYDDAGAEHAAEVGDQLKIDFVGKVDGVAFEGGTGTDMTVVIGANAFIPGFEEGLKGAKAGDTRAVTATFPETYGKAELANKTAIFDTVVKSIGRPKKPELNDEFAKTLGLDDMGKLREVITSQIKGQYDQLSRVKLKRELLDQLDKAHTFDLPESLVETEFNGIWQQINDQLKAADKTFESEGKTEESAKAEYRKIAERRVRLGLVIGEVGDKNKIQVTQDELRRALLEQTRRFPGQEQMVYDFYNKNPGALTELRAPIFEDKVVDHILDIAKPTERTVSREDLLKAAQAEQDGI